MYRIELSPGEETIYRNIDELATGVRNGLVTPRSRIYHAASQKWLPIEFHPHYKKIVENPAAKTFEAARPRNSGPVLVLTLPKTATANEPEAPTPAATPDSPPVSDDDIPAAVPSPVLQLPKLGYPRIVPAEPPVPIFAPTPVAAPPALAPSEPAPAPVATVTDGPPPLEIPDWPEPRLEPPPIDEPNPNLRRLRLVAIAGFVAAGGYALLSALGPDLHGSSAPAARFAQRPAMPAMVRTDSVSTPRAAGPSTRSSAAAPMAVTAGFAPAVPPDSARRAALPGASDRSPAAIAAEQSAPSSTSPSATPPAPSVDLAMPALPRPDSLVTVPRGSTDSAQLQKILRAVSGKSPASR